MSERVVGKLWHVCGESNGMMYADIEYASLGHVLMLGGYVESPYKSRYIFSEDLENCERQ